MEIKQKNNKVIEMETPEQEATRLRDIYLTDEEGVLSYTDKGLEMLIKDVKSKCSNK